MKLKQHHPKAALRILAGLLLFFMTIASPAMAASSGNGWDGRPATQIENTGSGDGTAPNKAILIKDAAELAYLAQQVNDKGWILELGNGTDIDNSGDTNKQGFVGYYFALSADIDLSAHNWTPIGNDRNSFRGHFDGDGHKVIGLKIDIKDETSNWVEAGLFGNVYYGSIGNLGVGLSKEGIMVSANGDAYVGGIAGDINYTPISNCYVDSEGNGKISVTCKGGYIGGIAGYFLNDKITHCYSTTDMEVEASGDANVGGIAGYCAGEMSYTYATGKMKITNVGSGSVKAGGICGDASSSSITNNLALNKEINVEGGSSNEVHRIVGATEFTFSANYASPRMLLNGKKVSDDATGGNNGENTYSDKFGEDIKNAGNKWGTAWDWTTPGNLPQLKKKTGNDTYGDLLGGQKTLAATDYLPHSPWSENVAAAIENEGGNDGLTPNTPIKIKDAGELAYFAQQVNARGGIQLTYYGSNPSGIIINHDGNGDEGFSGYHFALSDSIDLQAGNWTPIGNSNNPFRGHFDGKGYTVKGLAIEINKISGNDGDWTLAGLFGFVENGTFQNIGVELAEEGIQVSAENGNVYAGGITGRIQADGGDATLRHCYVTGKGEIVINADKDAFAGGIVGHAGQVSQATDVMSLAHCYATVNTQASSSNSDSYAGGIAGRLTGELSYCFATGKVEAKSGNYKFAGGICGSGYPSNCLALNGSIVGDENVSSRVTSEASSATNNYASTRTQVNGSLLSNQFDPSYTNGADTWLDTFKDDLLKAPATDNNGWKDGNGREDGNGWDWPDAPSTLLPKLTVVVTDNNGQVTGYANNWPGLPAQPDIDAANYLDKRQTLHIKQPQHGALGVFYEYGPAVPTDPLADGALVGPGSRLELKYASTTDGYSLDSYRWGTSDSNIPNTISGNTYEMPDHEVWLMAVETYTAPEQPPYVPPVYYTVTLPQVEGATTDPAAGAYEVEAWDTFRFYLTLDTAYSESQPVVTTSRNETIRPRTSDGAYLVKYVRSDVEIYIDGIVKNNAVANESITEAAAGPRIWSEGSMLCVDLPESYVTSGASPFPVRVLTVDGRLWRTFAASPGLNRWQLPQGLYIVQAGDAVRKVIVR